MQLNTKYVCEKQQIANRRSEFTTGTLDSHFVFSWFKRPMFCWRPKACVAQLNIRSVLSFHYFVRMK